jgi:hypothetical protein
MPRDGAADWLTLGPWPWSWKNPLIRRAGGFVGLVAAWIRSNGGAPTANLRLSRGAPDFLRSRTWCPGHLPALAPGPEDAGGGPPSCQIFQG